MTATDAKARAIVACPDGDTGILVFVPVDRFTSRPKTKHARTHRGAKAVVVRAGRHLYFPPCDLEVVA